MHMLIWHQFVHNDEVRRIAKQPNLRVIIHSRRLSLFRHIARLDVGMLHVLMMTRMPMMLTALSPEN